MTRGALERADLEKHIHHHDEGYITYFKGGDGPPLVFVHGLSDQAGSWFRIVPHIEDRTVVVIDLPRHGESPYKTDAPDFNDEVYGPLFEVFDEIAGDEEMTMVANSLGGWIAMEYALYSPENVDHLVLINSAGLDHRIDPTLIMPRSRDEARRTVRTIFGDSAPWVPGFVLDRIVERSKVSLVGETLGKADGTEFLDERLPMLNVESDLIWGTSDELFPVDYAHRLDALLPNSRLHLIDGCGHSPQVGCPGDLNDILDDIL